MLSGAQRQRRRRRKLGDRGMADVSVTVPLRDRRRLREFAKLLRQRRVPQNVEGNRLGRVIAALRAARDRLRDLGVLHAAVFGPTARGEEAAGSDIDIALEVDPRTGGDALNVILIRAAVGDVLPRGMKAAVIDRARLGPEDKARAEEEMIEAF
jgi:hypothetical protein